MNVDSNLISRKALLWPVAGLVLGAVAATNPFHAHHITLQAGVAAWWVSMLIVLMLSAHPAGARVGAVIAGLFAAIPCFVDSSPLARCLLMCFMGIPFIFAAAIVLIPPFGGFRSRLRYLCSWLGTRRVECRPRRIDTAALQTLTIATAIFSAAMVVITVTPDFGIWMLLRWLAGGVIVIAVAEMATRMAGMERPEDMLIFLIVIVLTGFVGVAIGISVLIRDTTAAIQKSHENGIRFSLRTLLIATTLVAVVLGLAVYATR